MILDILLQGAPVAILKNNIKVLLRLEFVIDLYYIFRVKVPQNSDLINDVFPGRFI